MSSEYMRIPHHGSGRSPRVQCPEHGVKTISVLWVAPKLRLTTEFKALVSDRTGTSWCAVNRIMEHASEQGNSVARDVRVTTSSNP